MTAESGDQQEGSLESEVLKVRQPDPLSSESGRFRNRNTVLRDQLGIDRSRILPLRHKARDVEPVTVSQVGTSQLLNKAFEGGSD